MKIFRFDPEVGKNIDRFNSSGFIISRVVQLLDEAVVSCAYLSRDGVIGYHQANIPQLFLVVHGEGWVRAENAVKLRSKQARSPFGRRENGMNRAQKLA